jgi:hypothetical protein
MAKPEDRTKLVDPTELLFRRVHPSQIKDGRPSKTTFLPRPADEGLVSVDRSSVFTAQQSYSAYAAAKSFRDSEGGIWGVTVGECSAHSVGCVSDPLSAEEYGGPNPAHSLIDMQALSEEATHTVAAELFAAAKARGRLAP